MDIIDKDKFRKAYTREFSRVYSEGDLRKEQDQLTKRLKEIDSILGEITVCKVDHEKKISGGK